MRNLKQSAICIVLWFWATSAFAEVIDKIVTVVNDKFIITLSDIRKERAIQLVLGGTDLGTDDQVASAIVEKYVVEEQMAQYPMIPITEESIQERLAAIANPRGFSPQELRDAVVSKLRRGAFMVQRFGPFVEVSDEELRKYFDDVYVPALRREGEPIPTLEQARDTVRRLVVAGKIEPELDMWMSDLLRRTKVEKVSK
jgi:hypothetical protein